MKTTQHDNIFCVLAIILLAIVRSTHQTVYSCSASVSCGCSTNSATVTRIVGGESANSSTWGWAVSVSIGGTYLCGGSIISSSWITTAAHCVYGYTASQVTIFAGSITRFVGTQTRVGSQLIIHPNYSTTTYVNDIALLQLASPLSMSDPDVSAICLPSISSSILSAGEWPAANTTVVAVGWGTLTENGALPLTLQQVTLQTVDYRASTCAPSMTDWHVQLCAGVSGGGKDTCQGDSGGPLMMFTSSRQWLLIGVTSNGIGCARATDSGVYTRVAAFVSWIYSITNGSISTLTSTVPTTSISSIQTTASSSSSSRTSASTSSSSSSRTSASTSSSSSSRTSASTSSSKTSRRSTTAVVSHANAVGISIVTVFLFLLFNLFIAFFSHFH